MRTVATVLLLAFAACTSVPQAPVPRALARFADACQFVPPDMLSFSFREAELDPELFGLPATTPRRMLHVRAGRDFAAPASHGYGSYRGVAITDFGAGGLSGYAACEDSAPTTAIAGIPVWFTPERNGDGQAASSYAAASWRACVDDRYLITSSTRDTLSKALERTGRLDQLLSPFAALRDLADDAEDIVCVLPRPGDQTYWGRVVPIEPVVTAVRPAPRRLQAFHLQPLPPQYHGVFEFVGGRSQRTSSRVGPWLVTEVPIAEDTPPYTTLTGGLAFDALFGLAIFI